MTNNDNLPGILVERVAKALSKQMEAQADDDTPSSVHRQKGLIWLEGWFDLRAALSAISAQSGWLPIESAPKDGTWFIAKVRDCIPAIVRWNENGWDGGNVNEDGDAEVIEPFMWPLELWLPLSVFPAAPGTEQPDARDDDAIEAETMRQMRDIAINELGCTDVLDALEKLAARDALIAELVEALDWIDLHKDDQDMNHVNFRIGAGSRAGDALAKIKGHQ